MIYRHTEITNDKDSKDLIALEELIIEFLSNEGIASYWEKKSLDEFGIFFFKFFQIQHRSTCNDKTLYSIDLLDDYYTCYSGYKGKTILNFNYKLIFEKFNTLVTTNRRKRKISLFLNQSYLYN